MRQKGITGIKHLWAGLLLPQLSLLEGVVWKVLGLSSTEGHRV